MLSLDMLPQPSGDGMERLKIVWGNGEVGLSEWELLRASLIEGVCLLGASINGTTALVGRQGN